MSELIKKIQEEQAVGFTHAGKFHADDVFASALLLHLNPDMEIRRGNQVPEEFEGIVYDIGRGQYDHHQRDSRVRENGVPFAAFGLLWEELGPHILGEELAARFDEEFVQPLDLNDNTGEKNELAALIGDFNPTWDDQSSSDLGFFQAVGVAEMILNNKFAKYKSNEKADQIVDDCLLEVSATDEEQYAGIYEDGKVLVLNRFVPFQKKLTNTDIEFVIFPSNRGGYCIQPIKKPDSMNYKCSFPVQWLGLDGAELQEVTGIATAQFCHKGGFLMTVSELEDARKACTLSISSYIEKLHYTIVVENEMQASDMKQMLKAHIQQHRTAPVNAVITVLYFPEWTELDCIGQLGSVSMEKKDWKQIQNDLVTKIKKSGPEAVVVEGSQLYSYPLIHSLRKKRFPVLVPFSQNGERKLIRIPSGS